MTGETITWAVVAYALITFLEKVWDRWQLRTAARELAKKTADEAAAVKKALAEGDQRKLDHLNAQDQTLRGIVRGVSDVASDVSEVKEKTNGLLLEKESADFARGAKSATDKADHPAPPGTH